MHHGRRPRQKFRPMPTLYDRAFATADDHSKYSLLWDMDSIPFVIDNPATEIIYSQRRLIYRPTGPYIGEPGYSRRADHRNQTCW